MTSSSGVEFEIASVITGVILVFSACTTFVEHLIEKKKLENVDNEEGRA